MSEPSVRILVTGSRRTTPREALVVGRVLDRFTAGITGPIVVVHGACPYGGVDLDADCWAMLDPRATPEPHPAKRTTSGRLLGPERNTAMVDLGADLCLAFPAPDSRGTLDCLMKAIKAGIDTFVTPLSGKGWFA